MHIPKITFGPVPSRRLGRSLGINNIPPKVCSYSCVYCQVGRTRQYEVKPRPFYPPEEMQRQVGARLAAIRSQGEKVDYLTFVPDGEPTLDSRLGKTIEALRPLGVKIAVITNSSLLWQPEVQNNLQKADWVSVKIDAVDGSIWQRINRPCKGLKLDTVLDGIARFSREYHGHLVTETMLVDQLNAAATSITAVADFIAGISPRKAYLAIPTRPPAEKEVRPPCTTDLMAAYQIMKKRVPDTEYLVEYEGEDFTATGDIRNEILGILAVHPLRQEAVARLLRGAGADLKVIDELIRGKKITSTYYQGKTFYLRNVGKNLPEE